MVKSIIWALYLIRLLSRFHGNGRLDMTPPPDVTSQNRQIAVYDGIMNYIDTRNYNSGRAIVFLHGNPTSSYLWRNVIPHVSDVARCVAPDLIGMGRSSKIEGSLYTFQDHIRYLSRWIESVNLPRKINFVVHDWGSALAFHWARLNPERVESITFMEAIIGPLSWDNFGDEERVVFEALRSPAGEQLVLQDNFFVERLLPGFIQRNLTEEEFARYREPFLEPGESRRPTLTFPRELPIISDGPDDVISLARLWNAWLSNSTNIPKLYIHAVPGELSAITLGEVINWPNLRMATVRGIHYIQEDSPNDIGQALRDFLLNYVWRPSSN